MRLPTIARRVMGTRAGRLFASRLGNPLFDAAWYRERYPDVPAGLRAWIHWRRHGWREGRDPSVAFQTRWYLERNRDVAARRMDPLEHYLRWGAAEGRQPSPSFEPAWYLERYPDVAASGDDPLLHYLRHGRMEDRLTQPPAARPTRS